MGISIKHVWVGLFLVMLLFGVASSALGQATVTTDKLNYSPDETVVITGTGWMPGETVSLTITEAPPVCSPQVLYAVADSDSQIINQDFVAHKHGEATLFLIEAQGLESGLSAQTQFVDGYIVNQVVLGPQVPPTVAPGETATYSVSIRVLIFWWAGSAYLTTPPYPPLPGGTTATFSPNPVPTPWWIYPVYRWFHSTMTIAVDPGTPPGNYGFMVRATHSYNYPEDYASASGVLAVAIPTVTVDGLVSSDCDGPRPDVAVSLLDGTGGLHSTSTGPDGRYSLAGIPAGGVGTLSITVPAGYTAVSPPRGTTTVPLTSDQTVNFDLACVGFDIKPTSCPNPFNITGLRDKGGGNGKDPGKSLNKGGVLPTAIVGSESFDVTEVDVSTLLLEGIEPLRHAYEDVTRPVTDGGECACTPEGPDGIVDLTLKFSCKEIAGAIGDVEDGDVMPLTITGSLTDGTPFEASDCVLILSKGQDMPSVAPEGAAPQSEIELGPIAPNPFKGVTRITYWLPGSQSVKLSIYDAAGRLISTLVEGVESAGEHVVEWDGSGAPSGIYFARLEAGRDVKVKRIRLVK